MNGIVILNSKNGNSLADFAVTTALMATLAATAAPAFSRIGEGAKAKKTKDNLQKIGIAARNWYNYKIEITGMGTFPGQFHREDDIGNVDDDNNNRRLDESEIENSTFLPVWADTAFLHQFDNDTIASPYQDGQYYYGVLGGSGTGDDIVSPIFVVVDIENEEDFFYYFKP